MGKYGRESDAAQAYEALHQGKPTSAVEYAREFFIAAKESPFSTKEMDDVVDAELAKLP